MTQYLSVISIYMSLPVGKIIELYTIQLYITFVVKQWFQGILVTTEYFPRRFR